MKLILSRGSTKIVLSVSTTPPANRKWFFIGVEKGFACGLGKPKKAIYDWRCFIFPRFACRQICLANFAPNPLI